MRRIQRLKLLWRERQRKRDGVFLDVLQRTGFGNGDHVAAADGPGERHRRRGAAVGGADLGERGIAHEIVAERRIGHHRYAALPAPGQEIALDTAIAEVVADLIGGAAIAVRNTEEVFHVADAEVRYAPGANLP